MSDTNIQLIEQSIRGNKHNDFSASQIYIVPKKKKENVMLDIYEKANNVRHVGTYSGVFEINGNSISGVLEIKDKIELSLVYSNNETFVLPSEDT